MTTDPRDGIPITNSLIKTMLQCPRQAMYKHIDLLGPRLEKRQPLKRGSWFHELLEAYYKGESVNERHKQLTHEYSKLMDEEKEALGDLPKEMAILFKAYMWHYHKDDSWTIHEVEFKLEAELPNGMQFQGKSDMLIEDEFGLWVVDHKTHKVLPSIDFRLRDSQKTLYIWACRQNDIPVRGFIWNYIVPKSPAPIKFTKAGQPYKRQGMTDYPTALKSIKAAGKDPDEYAYILDPLLRMRYDPHSDIPQASPMFRRDVLEIDEGMIERSLKGYCHTAERFRDYNFEDRDAVERNPSRGCDWCSYRSLCNAELMGTNVDNVRRQEFKKVDPFAYYEEEKNRGSD